jgi:glycogen(starch) synthase
MPPGAGALRVLMTADTVGGVWTYALELASALSAQGAVVSLATMGAPLTRDQRTEIRGRRGLDVHESTYRLEWMEDPWADVAAAGDWLLALEERLQPDIVHLNGYAHGSLPWLTPTVMVAHSCVLSWWRAVKGGDAPARWDRYRREVARGLRAADVLVAPSRWMLDAAERHHGRARRACVIPNARRPDLFEPAPKEPFVLAAGRVWDEAKNLRCLDRVAARLSWPVKLAGAVEHPDGGRVELGRAEALGHLPPAELAAWLGRAAIYASPALYEPFGLSALEAGLAGCALVLADIPSLREVWGDAAVFVPPQDDDAWAEALNTLARDHGRRAALAVSARRRARSFTPERMARAYRTTYEHARSARARVEATA